MREMKDSGIEWIGLIPSNWDIIKNKHIFYEVCDLCTQEGSLPLLSVSEYYGVALKSEKIKEGNFETHAESVIGYKICKSNDLVFNIMLSWKRALGLSIYDGIVSPAYCVYRKKTDSVFPKYYHYLFRTNQCADEFKRFSTGIIDSRLRLYPEVFFSLNAVLPSYEEQSLIASFLDTKCAEIDSISEDIQKEIETLQEYRKSVITEAVTKGLDPNVEMKDSGVEWIGEIPSNWKVRKIKHSLRREEPKNPGNVPVLSLYREYGIVPKDSRDDNHNVTSLDTSKYKYVLPGDFVINKMKAWQGSVAVSKFEGIVSPAYYVYHFKDKNICKEYFHFLLRSCYKDEFRRISGGIREGQWDLPSEMFETIPFLMPPYKEQQNIVSYLDAKCAEIDSIIREKQKQLDTLAEYRKSLIYEYVTGKKEVPTT